jgi:hypothetical protein
MITYVIGNVFDHLNEPCIFVHGCNAQRTMGAGVAKTVKANYPAAYQAYMGMKMQLGEISYAELDNGIIICNLISQRFYGRTARQYVDYDAVCRGLTEVGYVAKGLQLPVKMPFIGSGLGGGDRHTLFEIFSEALADIEVTVFSLDSE